jgi:hypothetical protein
MAKGIALRKWALHLKDYETEDDFRQAVAAELAGFEHIGERLGVGVVAAPIRAREGGEWFTRAWVFQTATVPAAHIGEPEDEDVEDVDLDRAVGLTE